MIKVLTAAQMREVDRLTTERYGIPSIILMENAAHAVARVISEKLGGSVKGRSILILCGKGNNGGDGAALARILWSDGADVHVCLAGKISETQGDAKTNFVSINELAASNTEWNTLIFRECSSLGEWEAFSNEHLEIEDPDVVIDALVGTGLSRPLEGVVGEIASYVRGLNVAGVEQGVLVVSVDMPSGLDADRDQWLGGSVVRASVTVTFTAPKAANVLPPVAEFNGELVVANIGSPQELITEKSSQLYLAEQSDAAKWLLRSAFSSDDHKNKRGHVLLIAGSADYSGAAVLAANAAMRSGAGLATLACPADAKVEIASRLLPEVILSTIDSDELASHLERADAVAVGCGVDVTDAAVANVVRQLIENRTKPTIVDAGALALLPRPDREQGRNKGDAVLTGGSALSSDEDVARIALADARASATENIPLILTPHVGEFLRMLGTDDRSAIADRVAAVRTYAMQAGAILVLKGERVLIGAPDGRVVVNPTGNSGLGKAGNGDTLAGILAGFVAQAARMHIDIFETVVAAVYIAGLAGDIAELKYGKRVMSASDVRECLADAFAGFDKAWINPLSVSDQP